MCFIGIVFLHMEGKTLYQQKDYNLLYCNTRVSRPCLPCIKTNKQNPKTTTSVKCNKVNSNKIKYVGSKQSWFNQFICLEMSKHQYGQGDTHWPHKGRRRAQWGPGPCAAWAVAQGKHQKWPLWHQNSSNNSEIIKTHHTSKSLTVKTNLVLSWALVIEIILEELINMQSTPAYNHKGISKTHFQYEEIIYLCLILKQ